MFVDIKEDLVKYDSERILEIEGYANYVQNSPINVVFFPEDWEFEVFWCLGFGRVYEKDGGWFWELEFSEEGCRVYRSE